MNEAVDSRAIIVVGGSDGIGLTLTRQLLDEGRRVIGVSRRPSSITHERYRHETLDVSDARYGELLDRILSEAGAPIALFYCVGIAERPTIEELERDVRVFQVNLLAAVKTAERVLPRMQASGGGRFIVLSSQADRIINAEAPSYTASKAALSAYFEGLGYRLRKTPLRVINVRFGFVETKLARAGWQPFLLTREQAAARLCQLLEGPAPLRVTYPLRAACLVAIAERVTRLMIRLG